MRLFIAIQFDEPILEILTNLQEELKAQNVEGNYTRRENLHLTLAFVGEYGNPDDVLDAMEGAGFRPFDIALDGMGCHHGDLLWAGIADNGDLASYVKRLRRALSNQGIPFDKKRFAPHITLVRKAVWRNGQGLPAVNSPAGRMCVRRISLMKSERGKRGMIYTEIGGVGEEIMVL